MKHNANQLSHFAVNTGPYALQKESQPVLLTDLLTMLMNANNTTMDVKQK